MAQFIDWDADKAALRWIPKVEHVSSHRPNEQEMPYASLGRPFPGYAWALMVTFISASGVSVEMSPQGQGTLLHHRRLVAPKELLVEFCLGHCSSFRGQREDPQPSGASSTRRRLLANLVWMPILVTPHPPQHSHFSRSPGLSAT